MYSASETFGYCDWCLLWPEGKIFPQSWTKPVCWYVGIFTVDKEIITIFSATKELNVKYWTCIMLLSLPDKWNQFSSLCSAIWFRSGMLSCHVPSGGSGLRAVQYNYKITGRLKNVQSKEIHSTFIITRRVLFQCIAIGLRWSLFDLMSCLYPSLVSLCTLRFIVYFF